MILYRPVSLQELESIYDSGMKAFPARLPQQPIFYPVLDLEYARKTASDWNVKRGQFAGYVTQFKVDDDFIKHYEKHAVGKTDYQELWIPEEDMEEFNRHLVGHIKVVEAYFGGKFQGFSPEAFALAGKDAVEQFTLLANSYVYKRMEFYLEIKRNHKAIFLNYPFWQKHTFKNPGLKAKVVQAIKEAWSTSFPNLPLLTPGPENAGPIPAADSSKTGEPPSQEEDAPQKATVSKTSPKPAPPQVIPVQPKVSPAVTREIHNPPVPVKPRNLPSLVNPAHTDAPSPTPAKADPVIEPIRESPVDERDSQSFEDDWDDDFVSEGPIDPKSEKKSLYEQGASIKRSDEREDEDLFDEDAESDSAIESETNPPLFSVREERPSVERTFFPVLKSTPAENVPPALPTSSHFAQGVESGLRGTFQEAIDELTRSVEENANQVVAHTSLGVAFHRLGEDDRALASFENALKINANDPEAHYFRANILYGQGNERDAIAGYTIAMGLKPELIIAHQQPRPEDRLTDYTAIPGGLPRIARPALRILQLDRSLEVNKGQAELLKERAAEYYRLWNYEQAVADYNAFLAIQPNDAGAHHARGVAYEQLGQFDRALADYQRAAALDPQLSDQYIQRGVTYGNAGNFRQSIASLTEGIRLAPRNPDAFFNRGTSYVQLNDFENAIADFSRVIQLSPNDDSAYYWRGISNEAVGHQADAIADYHQFLTLSQDPRARQEIEQRLKQWGAGKRSATSGRDIEANEPQKIDQAPSQGGGPVVDIYDLIVALGERALHSTWLVSGVECYGEKAQELYALIDENRPIPGSDLLHITSGVRQTIKGDFTAFDPDSESHWLFLRAWEGNGFYIEINDPKNKQRLKTRFPALEEVEGASPTYESLFLQV